MVSAIYFRKPANIALVETDACFIMGEPGARSPACHGYQGSKGRCRTATAVPSSPDETPPTTLVTSAGIILPRSTSALIYRLQFPTSSVIARSPAPHSTTTRPRAFRKRHGVAQEVAVRHTSQPTWQTKCRHLSQASGSRRRVQLSPTSRQPVVSVYDSYDSERQQRWFRTAEQCSADHPGSIYARQ